MKTMYVTFTDSYPRIYPDISVNGSVLTAFPGETYNLDFIPTDGRWSESTQTGLDSPVSPAKPKTVESTDSPETEQ
jgi:hypothetical protein